MNFQQIRMIACDLDGTLLHSDHSCSTYATMVWMKLLEKGRYFIPVSGRPFSALKRNIPIEICTDIVCANGARIYSKTEEETLKLVKSQDLSWNLAAKVIKLQQEKFPNVHLQLYQGEDLYTVTTNLFTDEYTQRTQLRYNFIASWDEIAGRGVSKLMFIDSNPALLQEAAERLLGIEGVHCMLSSSQYLEVFSDRASKGNALKYLMEKYTLRPHNLLALGDSYNDIPMFEVCRHGYVMKNANKDLLPELPRTSHTNDEDGAPRLLEELLNST